VSLQNGIVHRDLKLENILLDDDGNIKVSSGARVRVSSCVCVCVCVRSRKLRHTRSFCRCSLVVLLNKAINTQCEIAALIYFLLYETSCKTALMETSASHDIIHNKRGSNIKHVKETTLIKR